MSEQGAETSDEGVVLLTLGEDAAFGALMDTLVAEENQEETQEEPGAGGSSAGDDGVNSPEDQGAGTEAPDGGAPAGGDAGESADSPTAGTAAEGADTAGADGGASGVGTVDVASISSAWGEISAALEEGAQEVHKQAAFEEVQTEYPRYFEALGKHPRLLVGMEVPAIGREGMELLKDSADAKEWQEAVKAVLSDEITERAQKAFDNDSGSLRVVYEAISLFQSNNDLVPGTKQFDRELANEFAKLAKPYENRVDGKLQGYSIPVQPLIDQVRNRLKEQRAAKPASTPAAEPAAKAAPAAKSVRKPQAGVQSKAGQSSESEDYSTLFGTLGLPNLVI